MSVQGQPSSDGSGIAVGTPGAVPFVRPDFSQAIRTAALRTAENFASILSLASNPLRWDEYQELKDIVQPGYAANPANKLAAQQKLDNCKVDWRTVPPADVLGSQVGGAFAGPVFAGALSGEGWGKTEANFSSLLQKLGDDDFDVRMQAQGQLDSLLTKAADDGDFLRLWLIFDKIEEQIQNNDDPDITDQLSRALIRIV